MIVTRVFLYEVVRILAMTLGRIRARDSSRISGRILGRILASTFLTLKRERGVWGARPPPFLWAGGNGTTLLCSQWNLTIEHVTL